MKKRVLPLFLALALCVGLTVPAMAGDKEITDAYISFYDSSNHTMYLNESQSYTGLSFDLDSYTLTLNGFNAQDLWINNTDRVLTIVLTDGSVNNLTFNGLQITSCREDVVITGGGTLNTACITAGFSAYKKVLMKSGTVNVTGTDIGIGLNGGGLQIEGGTLTSKAYLWRTSNMKEDFCKVLGGTLILDTQSTAVKMFGGDVATGLEGAKIVGSNGQTLQIKNVDGSAQVVDSSGNISAYAKITAAGSPAPVQEEPTVGSFTDVKQTAYYAAPVAWAVEKGITNGTSATTFSPDQTCTRAQIITFLWRAAGSPEPKNISAFSDVKPDAYYAKATAWAKESGMAGGDTFSPDAPCTREMAVEFMWKHAGSPNAAAASFSDVSSPAVNWAVEKGVTNGTSATTFSPDATCTRGQIVTFLYRGFAE